VPFILPLAPCPYSSPLPLLMRWYIVRALLAKEWQRHLANRGGIALAILLVATAVLLSVFAPQGSSAGTGVVGGVHHCFVEFDARTPFIVHLEENVPKELSAQIVFRKLEEPDSINGLVVYQTGIGALQIRQTPPDKSPIPIQWPWLHTRRGSGKRRIAISPSGRG
jgi:hypothetical protein